MTNVISLKGIYAAVCSVSMCFEEADLKSLWIDARGTFLPKVMAFFIVCFNYTTSAIAGGGVGDNAIQHFMVLVCNDS